MPAANRRVLLTAQITRLDFFFKTRSSRGRKHLNSIHRQWHWAKSFGFTMLCICLSIRHFVKGNVCWKCGLFCLVHIKKRSFESLVCFICFLERYQSSLLSICFSNVWRPVLCSGVLADSRTNMSKDTAECHGHRPGNHRVWCNLSLQICTQGEGRGEGWISRIQ